LNEIDKEKVIQFYADIRKESSVVGGIPIGVRHIESVLRMSESHAKMHLRDYVRSDDIDVAIDMMLESFLQSQKVSVGRQLRKKFEPYQQKKSDPNQLLIHTLNKMVHERVSITVKSNIMLRLFMRRSLKE
jgi:DNA replication licensing factor MCM2